MTGPARRRGPDRHVDGPSGLPEGDRHPAADAAAAPVTQATRRAG
jgi:hypothetical protein